MSGKIEVHVSYDNLSRCRTIMELSHVKKKIVYS